VLSVKLCCRAQINDQYCFYCNDRDGRELRSNDVSAIAPGAFDGLGSLEKL